MIDDDKNDSFKKMFANSLKKSFAIPVDMCSCGTFAKKLAQSFSGPLRQFFSNMSCLICPHLRQFFAPFVPGTLDKNGPE
jgi:hypothetical protein